MEYPTRFTPADLVRLMDMVIAIAARDDCSPSQAIETLGQGAQAVPRREPSTLEQATSTGVLGDYLGGIRDVRMKRNELLDAPIFRESAWDMMLELFSAHQQGRDLSVTSLCYASGAPQTTALRQLGRLEHYGLVKREGDRDDQRRCYVRLTAKGLAGVAETGRRFIGHSLRAANA